MTALPSTLDPAVRPRLGVLVLQADETLEDEFRAALPPGVSCQVGRVPSAATVSSENLSAMEARLTAAAALFPEGAEYDVVAYACTSATARIGAAQVANRIREGVRTRHVTDPVTALIAGCRARGITRLALVSPYVADVSARLREVLDEAGIATPVFGSFEEAVEARVARIDAGSILEAGRALVRRGPVEGLFLSCTNLRTRGVREALEAELGLPVMSSNSVLMEHMLDLAQ